MLPSNRDRFLIRVRSLGAILPALVFAACASDNSSATTADAAADTPVQDIAAQDSAAQDSAAQDSGMPDSSVADASVPGSDAPDVPAIDVPATDVPAIDVPAIDVTVADVTAIDVTVADAIVADVTVADATTDVAVTDAAVDAGPPDVVCSTGTNCGGVCVDTTGSATDCGACGVVCPGGGRCEGGVCTATSCGALHAAAPALGSGVYLLDTDGDGPRAAFRAYCDMTNDGGGWTLALKIDGTLPTFVYAAALWTNAATLNPTSTDLTASEAKFDAFAQLPFTSVRLVMRQLAPAVTAPTDRAILIPAAATSMLAAVTSTGTVATTGPLRGSVTGVATAVALDEWRSLFESSGIQCNCGAQGFNADAQGTRLRLGIFGNQEGDCTSPDSNAGVGYDSYSSGNNALGAWACGSDYSGDRATRTFSWVYLR